MSSFCKSVEEDLINEVGLLQSQKWYLKDENWYDKSENLLESDKNFPICFHFQGNDLYVYHFKNEKQYKGVCVFLTQNSFNLTLWLDEMIYKTTFLLEIAENNIKMKVIMQNKQKRE